MSEDSEIPESTAFLAFLYDITGSTKQVENEQADKLNLMNGELIADALAILIQGYGIGIPKKDTEKLTEVSSLFACKLLLFAACYHPTLRSLVIPRIIAKEESIQIVLMKSLQEMSQVIEEQVQQGEQGDSIDVETEESISPVRQAVSTLQMSISYQKQSPINQSPQQTSINNSIQESLMQKDSNEEQQQIQSSPNIQHQGFGELENQRQSKVLISPEQEKQKNSLRQSEQITSPSIIPQTSFINHSITTSINPNSTEVEVLRQHTKELYSELLVLRSEKESLESVVTIRDRQITELRVNVESLQNEQDQLQKRVFELTLVAEENKNKRIQAEKKIQKVQVGNKPNYQLEDEDEEDEDDSQLGGRKKKRSRMETEISNQSEQQLIINQNNVQEEEDINDEQIGVNRALHRARERCDALSKIAADADEKFRASEAEVICLRSEVDSLRDKMHYFLSIEQELAETKSEKERLELILDSGAGSRIQQDPLSAVVAAAQQVEELRKEKRQALQAQSQAEEHAEAERIRARVSEAQSESAREELSSVKTARLRLESIVSELAAENEAIRKDVEREKERTQQAKDETKILQDELDVIRKQVDGILLSRNGSSPSKQDINVSSLFSHNEQTISGLQQLLEEAEKKKEREMIRVKEECEWRLSSSEREKEKAIREASETVRRVEEEKEQYIRELREGMRRELELERAKIQMKEKMRPGNSNRRSNIDGGSALFNDEESIYEDKSAVNNHSTSGSALKSGLFGTGLSKQLIEQQLADKDKLVLRAKESVRDAAQEMKEMQSCFFNLGFDIFVRGWKEMNGNNIDEGEKSNEIMKQRKLLDKQPPQQLYYGRQQQYLQQQNSRNIEERISPSSPSQFVMSSPSSSVLQPTRNKPPVPPRGRK